jgi:hypothetical protein
MIKSLIARLFGKSEIVSTSSRINSGYSSGRSDGSNSGQWYNG